MTTHILNYQSLPGLWQTYAENTRNFGFTAQTLAEAEAWQTALRSRLSVLLGGFPDTGCDLSPQQLSVKEYIYFQHTKVVLQAQPGEHMLVHVLTPVKPGSGPLKPVIALHGHGSWGAEALIHIPDNPMGAALNKELNYEYAAELVQRGYMVFVPELRGFGNRMENPIHQDQSDPSWISSCYADAVNALLLGKTLLGLRVNDIIRLVDYIATRPETSIDTLGCIGLSGGGMVTLFTAALDTRITCAVISGYFNTFRASIMALHHCLCNYVPGIALEAEMVDIAGLLAPRPLLVESGAGDPIFPVEAARNAYRELQNIYQVFSAPDQLESDFHAGAHAWSGAKAYDWLKRWL